MPLDLIFSGCTRIAAIQRQTNAEEETDAEEAEEPLGEGNEESAPIVDLGANARVMGPHRVRANHAWHDQVDEQAETPAAQCGEKAKISRSFVPMISFQRNAVTMRTGTIMVATSRIAASAKVSFAAIITLGGMTRTHAERR